MVLLSNYWFGVGTWLGLVGMELERETITGGLVDTLVTTSPVAAKVNNCYSISNLLIIFNSKPAPFVY